jgi:hypothetical protein
MALSTNDKEVFTTVHDAVAAAAVDSTTDDSDNSGGVSGPVVPGTKGNIDDADAMVDDKNKSSADDVSEKGGACKVIVGGGVVVGQVTKGNNDDVVVAAAVDSTTVDSDHSGGGGGPIVGPETKGNDDDADAMVDDKNKSSADDISGNERDSDEIDRMQNTIRKQLMKKRYRELWGEEHGYRTPPPPASSRILCLM